MTSRHQYYILYY